MTPKRFARAFAVRAPLMSCSPRSPSAAQVFGKNKVQYEPLEWSVLETPHLRLHYYAEEESLARHLVVYAESVCVEYDGRFRLPTTGARCRSCSIRSTTCSSRPTRRPDSVSEGTGGLTELIKGRVLLPHNGSWARLRWVTRHELDALVHAREDRRA